MVRGPNPAHWNATGLDVVGDQDEILWSWSTWPPNRAASGHFRESTRDERMALAAAAEQRFGRKVSWGARTGDMVVVFTTASVPVMTRLRLPERRVLDTLIDAGVARSRSEALAWCVRLVGDNETEWIADLRAAFAEVEAARDRGPRSRPDKDTDHRGTGLRPDAPGRRGRQAGVGGPGATAGVLLAALPGDPKPGSACSRTSGALDANRELHDALEGLQVAERHRRSVRFAASVVGAIPIAAPSSPLGPSRRCSWIDIIDLNVRMVARISARLLPLTAVDIMEADDWLIEQPCPVSFTSASWSPSDLHVEGYLVPAQRD